MQMKIGAATDVPVISWDSTLNISTAMLGNVKKGKRAKFEKKKRPTNETEEDWDIEEEYGGSCKCDVDKSMIIILL